MLYCYTVGPCCLFILLWDFHVAFDNDHPTIHLPIHSSISPSTHLPTHPLNYLASQPVTQSPIHPSIHPLTRPFIHPFILSSIYPPTYTSMHPFILPSTYLHIHASTTQLPDMSPLLEPAPWLPCYCSSLVYSHLLLSPLSQHLFYLPLKYQCYPRPCP